MSIFTVELLAADDVLNSKRGISRLLDIDFILALPAEEKPGIPNSIPETSFGAQLFVSILNIAGFVPLICNL